MSNKQGPRADMAKRNDRTGKFTVVSRTQQAVTKRGKISQADADRAVEIYLAEARR